MEIPITSHPSLPLVPHCPAWLVVVWGKQPKRSFLVYFSVKLDHCPFPTVYFEESLWKFVTIRNIASFPSHNFLMRADHQVRSTCSI